MLSLICLWMEHLILKDRCGSISKLRMLVLHVENSKESQDLKHFLVIFSSMQKLLLTTVSMNSINLDFNHCKTVDSKTVSLKKHIRTNLKQNGQQKQVQKQQPQISLESVQPSSSLMTKKKTSPITPHHLPLKLSQSISSKLNSGLIHILIR